MNYILFFASTIFGYYITNFFSGKSEGEQGIVKSLIFQFGGYTVHLHHWFVLLMLLLGLIYVWYRGGIGERTLYVIGGLLIGGIVQGLTYSDWYRIIYR